MRSFIITMTPRRVYLFATGRMKKDVRKTFNKAKPPYKCYVYCIADRHINAVERRIALRETGGMADKWRGRVIGEFICSEEKAVPTLPPLKFYDETLLTAQEYYALRKDWRNIRTLAISNRKVYEKPIELERFTTNYGTQMNRIFRQITEVKEIQI